MKFIKLYFYIILLYVSGIIFKFLKVNFKKNNQILVKYFILSNGKTPIFLKNLLFIKSNKISNLNSDNKKYELHTNDMQKNLKNNGYLVLPDFLSIDQCKYLEDLAKIIPGHQINDEKNFFINRSSMKFDSAISRFDLDSNYLVNDFVIQNIFSDIFLIDICSKYFGSLPILTAVSMWWSNYYSPLPDSKSAQLWHFDMDRIRWLKLFIYITDVDINSGPHQFVEGSHIDYGIPYNLLSKGYVRLTEDEISKNFNSNKIKTFTGKRGTLIIEDSRGLHRGFKPLSQNRLIFQLEFSVSSFGKEIPQLFLSSKSDNFNNIVNIEPLIFSCLKY
jgi:hypothetical protein